MAFERLADRLAGRGVPQPRRLVLRRGDDALAVGAERRALTTPAWPLSGSPIGLPVAASHSRAVLSVRRGDDALAVGAERRAIHIILMAFERLADRLAGLGVPQPRRLVLDAVTMRLPSGLNAALIHTIRMAFERLADRLAGRRRPTAAPSCP